ncbi:hypothetical protein BDV93DRAFT_559341 [Ceratobasidium sp. AG-I]|nr:hypothetical protein BDV93DRAFT_559341 [Ceratobasidium sp. AG-I]
MPPGPGGVGQKRPGSPPPPPTTNNLGGSPPDAKRPRPNDPGPAALADSRGDGRPSSSKGNMPFGAPQNMQGQGHPGMINGQQHQQQQQRMQDYKQNIVADHAQRSKQILSQGVQPPPFGKNQGQQNGYPAGPGPNRGPRPQDAPSPASGDGSGSAGAPRQLANVKGGGAMGPPASPSLANRHVGGVKKSESANSSPALASSTVPNGMDNRSRTPSGQQQQQQQGMSGRPPGAPPSPRTGPATRPQSAAPSTNQGSMMQPPAPSTSAPPILPPTQSPSNGMMSFKSSFTPNEAFGAPEGEFDFGPMLDFGQLTDEFFPEGVNEILGMSSLNEWPNDASRD